MERGKRDSVVGAEPGQRSFGENEIGAARDAEVGRAVANHQCVDGPAGRGDRLTRRGVLKQTVSKLDRRKRSIAITPKGVTLMARFQPKAERAQRRLLEVLSKQERQQFMSLLSRLVDQNNEFSRAPIRLDE